MFRTAVIVCLWALTPFIAAADSADVKWPDCYCTDTSGKRIELGEIICLTVDGRSYQARCEMMLNNPMWREIGSGCTVSRQDYLPAGHGMGTPAPLTGTG